MSARRPFSAMAALAALAVAGPAWAQAAGAAAGGPGGVLENAEQFVCTLVSVCAPTPGPVRPAPGPPPPPPGASAESPAASAPSLRPPPPPPPVYAAREFVVYFPSNESGLAPEGQSVAAEAANYARQGRAVRMTVVGHTDSVGSSANNLGLSERRAKAVANALMAYGVSSSALAVEWKGESQPAVATADGVREPLNNRVTVDIGF